jgi:hypothetical protein
MPAKSNTTVAMNGSVLKFIVGMAADRENGGKVKGCPLSAYTMPSMITSVAGIIEPAITPKDPNLLEVFSPISAMNVVPQKDPIIVININKLLVPGWD